MTCSSFSFAVCVSIFVLAYHIPLTYYGFEDEDDQCQKANRIGMVLSDWAKGAGLSGLIVAVFNLIVSALPKNHIKSIVAGVFTIFDIIFVIIWWIFGVIILATNENNDCVSDGTGMAVTSIIWLVLCEIRGGYASAHLVDIE